jgi:predicted DNA-binding transcriptional regulator AlpA
MLGDKTIMANSFISIGDKMTELGCSRRTVQRYIQRGALPPLPGNQKGVKAQGWPRTYYDTWMQEAAKTAVKLSEALGNPLQIGRQNVNIDPLGCTN